MKLWQLEMELANGKNLAKNETVKHFAIVTAAFGRTRIRLFQKFDDLELFHL